MPYVYLHISDRETASHDVEGKVLPTLRVRMGDVCLAVDEYALSAARQLSEHLVEGLAELERAIANARSAKTAGSPDGRPVDPPSATQVVGLPADTEMV